MNTEDKDLDRIFQEAAKDFSVPFQESYWAEMEALLPQNPKLKIGIWFWAAAASIALLFSVIGWNYFGNSTHSESLKQASLQAKTTKTNKLKSSSISSSKSTENVSEEQAKVEVLVYKNETTNLNSKVFKTKNENTVQQTSKLNGSTEPLLISENSSVFSEKSLSRENVTDLAIYPLNSIANTALDLAPKTFNFPVKKAPKNSIYVEAFGGIAQTLTQGETASPSLTYGIGAGISRKISSFSLRTGIKLRVLNTNNVEIKRNSKVYSFSSTHYEQNLDYGNLFYADIPLEVAFTKGKQAFFVGISPSFLLSSRLKYETRENEELTEKGSSWNQNLGLNRLHLNAVVGYELSVNDNWTAGVKISNSIIHPLKSDVFSSEKQAFPFQGNLTLKYTL